MKKMMMAGIIVGAMMAHAEDTIDLMQRVNNYQIAHPMMKADDRNWERGTWYTGVMAAYK